jgi:hypothetical protein
MQVIQKRVVKLEGDFSRDGVSWSSLFPSSIISSISFYTDPPQGPLTLSQFENYAMDRLDVLRFIEESRIKGLKGMELGERVRQKLEDMDLKTEPVNQKTTSEVLSREAEARRKDWIR